MNRFAFSSFAGLALAIVLGTTAHAGTLFTPSASFGFTGLCILTNVDTRPIDVTVGVLAPFSGGDITVSSNCTGTIQPGEACSAVGKGGWGGYCRFTSTSSRVRGALHIFDSASQQVGALPATK